MTGLKRHVNWFEQFAAAKIACANGDGSPLELKRLHTGMVLKNASLIAATENFCPQLRYACELAALYHDLARFDQFLQFQTFKDKLSVNHALWAVKLLKRHKRLQAEAPAIRKMALAAIAVHNRKAIPAGLRGNSLLAACVLRDADKTDIVRVMDEHLGGPGPYNPTVVLGLPDSPEQYSPKVIASALKGQAASYDDLKSVNDFKVLLGAWYFDMHFNGSRQVFIKNGNALNLILSLPAADPYMDVRSCLLEVLDPSKA